MNKNIKIRFNDSQLADFTFLPFDSNYKDVIGD